jgi:hypothetical protein
MRYMIMHKTNRFYEDGGMPPAELIQRVGAMVGELIAAGILKAGDGLGPSSQGARIRLAAGRAQVTPGPFDGEGALPARYAMFRAASLQEAAERAARFGRIFGDVTVDVRPVNEAWDLGFAPKPEGLTTRRYMAVAQADAASESGAEPTAGQREALQAFADDLGRADAYLGMERFEPSRSGKRVRASEGKRKIAVLDGPFTETKELIGGFVIVEVPKIEEAVAWARKYLENVDTVEVDVRGLADPPA